MHKPSFLASSPEINEWQVQKITKAVQISDQPGAKFIEHEEVASWLDRWGTKNELKSPTRS